jgi:hypothetical protein
MTFFAVWAVEEVYIAVEFADLPGDIRHIVMAQHIAPDFGKDRVALVLESDQDN